MNDRWVWLALLVAFPILYARWCVDQLQRDDEAFDRLDDGERALQIGDEYP